VLSVTAGREAAARHDPPDDEEGEDDPDGAATARGVGVKAATGQDANRPLSVATSDRTHPWSLASLYQTPSA
jgi:hypothetical protein